MRLQTIQWRNDAIRLIDQTQLPLKLRYLAIKDIRTLWKAIKLLQVRGAPALGAAAGLGVYLGIKDSRASTSTEFIRQLERVAAYIASSRPTARNLFWGLERMRRVALTHRSSTVGALKKLLYREALQIIAEDKQSCRRMAAYGAGLIKNRQRILTICNTGILATIDYGTALGVMCKAASQGKSLEVFACETRPLLQGSRLTTWELRRKRIPVTLICDSMAATLMQQGKIDLVIVGADRITAHGDTANKIGTYSLAVLSRYHRLPFYVAAPESTFDLSLSRGTGIPIEQRDADEVTELFFRRRMAAPGVKVYNPAFDVTPHELITAFITDRGVIRPPFEREIKKHLA